MDTKVITQPKNHRLPAAKSHFFQLRLAGLMAATLLLSQCYFDPFYPVGPDIPYSVYTHPNSTRYISLHQAGQRIYVEPPLPLEEDSAAFARSEGENVAWVPGRWMWEAENDRFVWLDGAWREHATAGHWVAGYWKQKGRSSWIWLKGYWSEDGVWPVNSVSSGLSEAPPPSRTEYPTAAPASHAVWIGGRWAWLHGDYVWTSGYWDYHPLSNDWVGGRWQYSGIGWYWVPGYWRTSQGHVLIHRHRNRARFRTGGRVRRGNPVRVETSVEDALPKP